MKFIRYGKYIGEAADAVDLEELSSGSAIFSSKAASSRNTTASTRWTRTARWKR